MSEEIDLVDFLYQQKIEIMLGQAIKHQFPNIKELTIHMEGDNSKVTFESGLYSKEEVESFIRQFINYDPR